LISKGRQLDDKDDLPMQQYQPPVAELPKLFDKLQKPQTAETQKLWTGLFQKSKVHNKMADRPREDADDLLKVIDDVMAAAGSGTQWKKTLKISQLKMIEALKLIMQEN